MGCKVEDVTYGDWWVVLLGCGDDLAVLCCSGLAECVAGVL